MRRILLKVVGWFAEFFPESHFYSSKWMRDASWLFVTGEHENDHLTNGHTILVGIAASAHRSGLKVGASFTADLTGVTDAGRSIGDYVVSVKRVR